MVRGIRRAHMQIGRLLKETWNCKESSLKNMKKWEDDCGEKFLNKLKKNIFMNPEQVYSKSDWTGRKDLLKDIYV